MAAVTLPAARLATLDDIDELVRLREVMFVSLGREYGDPRWQTSTRRVLERDLASGEVLGAVVDRPDAGLCACGLLEVATRVASPRYPLGLQGYLSSVSVDVGYRRRGLATELTELLVAEARSRGIERVLLHATEAGEPVYRAQGFVDRPGGRELVLNLVAPS